MLHTLSLPLLLSLSSADMSSLFLLVGGSPDLRGMLGSAGLLCGVLEFDVQLSGLGLFTAGLLTPTDLPLALCGVAEHACLAAALAGGPLEYMPATIAVKG